MPNGVCVVEGVQFLCLDNNLNVTDYKCKQ